MQHPGVKDFQVKKPHPPEPSLVIKSFDPEFQEPNWYVQSWESNGKSRMFIEQVVFEMIA